MSLVDTAIQVAGSCMILLAFAFSQREIISPESRTYLVLNIVGSVVLAVEAWVANQWGFLLLEAVWALVSIAAFVSRYWANGQGSHGVRSSPLK